MKLYGCPVDATPPTDQPIACTLDAEGMTAQLDEWAALRKQFQRMETTDHGARLWFEPAAATALTEVAAKEAACCTFLRLDVVQGDDNVRLAITSDHPDAQPVIAMLAAVVGAQPAADAVDAR